MKNAQYILVLQLTCFESHQNDIVFFGISIFTFQSNTFYTFLYLNLISIEIGIQKYRLFVPMTFESPFFFFMYFFFIYKWTLSIRMIGYALLFGWRSHVVHDEWNEADTTTKFYANKFEFSLKMGVEFDTWTWTNDITSKLYEKCQTNHQYKIFRGILVAKRFPLTLSLSLYIQHEHSLVY